ncbi:hypothetical protein TNCV_4743281 [Trichonephila clavipes]|nr:hypothetical protein TNCV_4743281 [Trichonephila clavipes]
MDVEEFLFFGGVHVEEDPLCAMSRRPQIAVTRSQGPPQEDGAAVEVMEIIFRSVPYMWYMLQRENVDDTPVYS